ncbi:hypothetical protein B0H11DRAFT_2242389 [Mycena galericulata]|nr:hypothetical protein B0H11DRAFT_2242389 [Mycena galericulata]
MPPPTVKNEAPGDTLTQSDPYAAAAAALEQAQRALSTARAQPLVATIPVAEAEEQLNKLRARISELEGDVDRYRRASKNLAEERDSARTEVEGKVRELAAMKEREREEIAASLKEERERLQKERDKMAQDRVALDAEKKALLEIRTLIAQKLENIDQPVNPDPLDPAPQPQNVTPMPETSVAVRPKPAASLPSRRLRLRLRRPAVREAKRPAKDDDLTAVDALVKASTRFTDSIKGLLVSERDMANLRAATLRRFLRRELDGHGLDRRKVEDAIAIDLKREAENVERNREENEKSRSTRKRKRTSALRPRDGGGDSGPKVKRLKLHASDEFSDSEAV